jgi:predicted AlkP superfamily phosphohydrolase/phosphomutase
MTKKTKFALIGLDSAIPSFVRKYFDMGILPNMRALAEEGTFSEILPVFPSHTAANWNTIATGAWPNTHGVTDMAIHLPGTPLTEVVSGFYSNLCQAEQLWKTAERSGKASILMKYIASWPPNIKNGIQVEGFGAPGGPGARPWGSSPLALSNSSCFSTLQMQNATQVSFTEPILVTPSPGQSGSRDSHDGQQPVAAEIKVGPHIGGGIPYTVTLQPSDHSGYEAAHITKSGSKEKEGSFVLKKGQISEWQIEDFDVDGKTVKASYRMKLVDLGSSSEPGSARSENGRGQKDAPTFRLFVSQIFPLEGWTYPDSIAHELVAKCGPFLESISHFPFAFGWTDENTFLDDLEYQAKWMTKATMYLMSSYSWDLYMTQWHGIDNAQHAFLRFDKSVLTPSQQELSERVVRRSYEIADDFVGGIAKSSGIATADGTIDGSNGHDDVHTFVISDHGHVMGKRRFFINQFLYEQGLIKLKRDQSTGKVSVDWSKTQAFAQGMVSVYVNLKGRDPEGSVKPGKEYEDLVDRIIEILYDVKDPLNGKRPFRLALSNRDSEFLGLSGERTGDVVTAVNPVYVPDNRMKFSGDLFENLNTGLPDGSIHGQQLPSVDLGEFGSIRSVLIAWGPTIKRGHVMKKAVKMVDIAPTISHILGIPAPKHSEGRVIHELFA